jgi:hypothetical protein
LLLPLANGLLDWLSWWVSRWLGNDLRKELVRAPAGRSMAKAVAKHASIELAVAIGLLLTLAFILGLSFGAAGHGEIGGTQARGLRLAQTIADTAKNPWSIGEGGGLWFTLMLVSTLIPTAIHFLFLLASPLALIQAGKQKREGLRVQLVPLSWDVMSADERSTLASQISRELVQRNLRIWVPAAMLFVLLIGGAVAAFAALVQEPWFAAVVAWFAQAGVNVAAWFLGSGG